MLDLQIHTNATPHHASWEPSALVAAAQAHGLHTIAVTDHNTLGSVRATMEAGQRVGVRVVPGVEIDSGFRAAPDAPLRLWHTLVYGVVPENEALQALCATVFERNLRDAEQLRYLLTEQGFVLHGLDALGRPPNVADVGTALARQNSVPGRTPGDDDEAVGMRYILQKVPDGYTPVGVDEVIAVAHANGGLAVLAHPGRSKGIYAVPATEADIATMAARGLDGIEVFYPSHSAEQRAWLREMVARYNLLITGGSDSHHPSQPLAAWPDEPMRPFLERVTQQLS